MSPLSSSLYLLHFHQLPCATSTHLLQTDTYSRYYCQIFTVLLEFAWICLKCSLRWKNIHFLPVPSVRLHRYPPWKKQSNIKYFSLNPSNLFLQVRRAGNSHLIFLHFVETNPEYSSYICHKSLGDVLVLTAMILSGKHVGLPEGRPAKLDLQKFSCW